MTPVPGAEVLWNIIGPLLFAMPRILAAVNVAPLFPRAVFPALVRNALAMSLSLCLYPHMAADMPPLPLAPLAWLPLIGKEILIGALVGLAIGTLIWTFESAGAIIDTQVGLSNAQLFDPFGGHQGGPTAPFMAQLAVILFVVGGGLYVLVSLLYESFRLWPVASFYPTLSARFRDFGGQHMGSLMQVVVRLEMPVILLLVLIDLGFGLLNRVAPQLNVFFFTMPIKGILAGLMIALYLSYLVDIAAGQLSELRTLLERLAPVLSMG